MAEGDGALYNYVKKEILDGNIDLVTDTLKVALMNSAYVPSIDSHDKWASISANDESGSGYSAGGKALASSKATTIDDVSDLAKFDAKDLTWTSLSVGTPAAAVLYDTTTSGSILVAYWSLATASNGGDFTLQWSSSGIITLS